MDYTYWLGSEQSYLDAESAVSKVAAYYDRHPEARATPAADSSEGEESGPKSPYLQIVDGVGIITIQGALYDTTFGRVGQWYGVCGYGDIREALVEAIKTYDIRSILLVVKSGGGTASGCSDTAEFIRQVDSIKPVYSYTPSTMCSAALWLGLAARKVYASNSAIVGSIGTISTVVSRHRALQEEGIDVAIVRSGKYKALGHPAEPLSELAIETEKAKVMYFNDMFVDYVADRRGTTSANVDAKYGQGMTLIGKQAVSAGLIDGVLDYSGAYSAAKIYGQPVNNARVVVAQVEDTVLAGHNVEHSQGTTMPNPHIPTPAELAAMAAGVDLNAPAASVQTAPATEPETTTVSADVSAMQATLTEVQGQLATAQASALEAGTQLAAVQAELATAQALSTELASVVANSVRGMQVGLNQKAEDMQGKTAADVLALHKEVSATFVARFKVGGVAATEKETQVEQPAAPAAAPNHLFMAAAKLRQTLKGA